LQAENRLPGRVHRIERENSLQEGKKCYVGEIRKKGWIKENRKIDSGAKEKRKKDRLKKGAGTKG